MRAQPALIPPSCASHEYTPVAPNLSKLKPAQIAFDAVELIESTCEYSFDDGKIPYATSRSVSSKLHAEVPNWQTRPTRRTRPTTLLLRVCFCVCDFGSRTPLGAAPILPYSSVCKFERETSWKIWGRRCKKVCSISEGLQR